MKCPVHRGHCKFTNAATPGSISTDFTSREEKHASELSVLRVRHKSEPALVFLHLCVCHPEPTWTAKVYKMRLSVMGNEARRCTTAASFETAHGGRQMVVPGQDGGDNSNTSPKMNDVSTATPSVRPALKCYMSNPDLTQPILSFFPSFFSLTIFFCSLLNPP